MTPEIRPSAATDGSFPVVPCGAGGYRVRRADGLLRAGGVRYADAARFAPPVLRPPLSGVVDATGRSPACPQPPDPTGERLIGPGALGDLPVDEHCQYLDVTAPGDVRPGERLPVMVFLHGGAYTFGAGGAAVNDPADLVREQRVVVVTVTYRLGLLGFLGGTDGSPANLGLLDALAALRWVARDVAAFGGDPASVTLFGQSAGADLAAHLMIADGAAGLFRRVILQSPPLGLAPGRARMMDAMAAEAARRVGPDTPVADVVAAQRAVASVAGRYGPFAAGMPFGTRYGHAPLPAEDRLDDAWRSVASGIEVLIGCTAREGAMFVPGAGALGRVPVVGRPVLDVAVGAVSDLVYGRAVRAFAQRHARADGRALVYRTAYGHPANPYADAHATDLPLLFGAPEVWSGSPLLDGVGWAEVERRGRGVREVWAGFARTGRCPSACTSGTVEISSVV